MADIERATLTFTEKLLAGVPDVASPQLVSRELSATLIDRDGDREIGSEEIFAVVRLTAPLGFSGDVRRTNEVEVPV